MERDIISKLKLYMEQSKTVTETVTGDHSQYTGHKAHTDNLAGQGIKDVNTSSGSKDNCSKYHKYDIDKILAGYIWEDTENEENEVSSCFILESQFPLSYIHGGYPVGKALDIDADSLKRLCPDIMCSNSISDFLFLDTETTGLSGGTGTVAFLIGTGFFKDDVFIVRQYFMRDYDEEIAMLKALNHLAVSYKGLVTFNGKAFDWNLMQTRYTFSRIKIPIEEILHIDLLYPARRIWGSSLDSCSLSSLEENILGEYRVNDIPGAMIPSVYFKYLEDRDAREIKRVIKHNEQDVLSMVSLLLKINDLLQNPIANTECEHELLGLGRIFEACGENENFIECLENCLNSENIFVKETASKKLSQIYKKTGNYEKAVEYWNSMISDRETLNIYPLIELAKYYEHKEKNIFKALEITEKAVQLSLKMGINNSIYREDLKKRLTRLTRKAGKIDNA
ncbi:MAG TPA: ribonuclease H-like domain-containing protein [Clostridiales bacterium]|nr:ribonuclease H-like domain-containing protein [Clostridiales bacterium]